MRHIVSLCLFLLGSYSTLSAQEIFRNFKINNVACQAVAISPDNQYVAGGSMGVLKIWEIESGKEVFSAQAHLQGLRGLVFSSDGRYLVSAGGFNELDNILVWDWKRNSLFKKLIGQKAVNVVRYVEKIDVLITGGLNGQVCVWKNPFSSNLSSPSQTLFEADEKMIWDIAFQSHLTEDWIWAVGSNLNQQKAVIKKGIALHGHSAQWTEKKSEYLQTYEENKDVCFYGVESIQDRYWLLGRENGDLKVWDSQNAQLYKDLTEPYTQIRKLRISPDENWLAVMSEQNTIRLFSLRNLQNLQESHKRICNFLGHLKKINDIGFSADSRFLASASDDGTIKIWKIDPYGYQKNEGVSSYTQMVQEYIRMKINDWQKRGKFERTVDYEARVNPTTLQEKVQAYSQEILAQIAFPKFDWKAIQNQYDADNEVFKLKLPHFEPFLLRVPHKEAMSFEQHIQQLTIRNPIFTLTEADELAIQHLEIAHPSTGKVYVYDSAFQLPFSIPLAQEMDTEPSHRTLMVQEHINSRQKTDAFYASSLSEVDFDLPKTKMKNNDAIAVVIGNRDYQKTKTVDFAIRDSRSIRNYLIDVMGFQSTNILYIENATLTDFKLIFGDKGNHRGKLFNLIKPHKSDVFIFYAGHGAPGLNDKKAYLVPTECDPQYVELTGYSTDVLYDNLAQLPAQSTVMLLDACFSGENIYQNISPIVIKSKGALGLKNGALLASSGADQVSSWYNEKKHGLFTYFFLKAIHNQNADRNRDKKLTLQEIFLYINDESEGIPYQARRLHGIRQNPVLKGQNIEKILVEYE